MAEGILNYDRKKIKYLLYIHVSIVVLFVLIFCAFSYSVYCAGYYAAEANSYFWMFFKTGMLLILLLVIAGLTYIIVPAKFGLKYYLPSLCFFVLSVLLVSCFFWVLPQRGGLMEGYYIYTKNNAKINDISKWLASYEIKGYDFVNPDGSKHGIVADTDWPESIKVLNPNDVLLFERNSNRHVRLRYSFGPEKSFGLCVSEEGVVVPLNDYYESEQRTFIQDNAFVWVH